MDTLAALALATEPPTDALLYRKPYSRHEYIISKLMMKHIIGQGVFQSTVIFILVFLGERFLFDIIGERQNQPNSILIISGRSYDWSKAIEDKYGKYSVHYTYIFNIFVFMTIFNLFNSRILDDSLNVFKNLFNSYYFIVITIIIVVM